jgi:hypothetical protein
MDKNCRAVLGMVLTRERQEPDVQPTASALRSLRSSSTLIISQRMSKKNQRHTKSEEGSALPRTGGPVFSNGLTGKSLSVSALINRESLIRKLGLQSDVEDSSERGQRRRRRSGRGRRRLTPSVLRACHASCGRCSRAQPTPLRHGIRWTGASIVALRKLSWVGVWAVPVRNMTRLIQTLELSSRR